MSIRLLLINVKVLSSVDYFLQILSILFHYTSWSPNSSVMHKSQHTNLVVAFELHCKLQLTSFDLDRLSNCLYSIVNVGLALGSKFQHCCIIIYLHITGKHDHHCSLHLCTFILTIRLHSGLV